MPRANTKNILLRDREEYTPAGLKAWSTESLRDEYSRLRRVANNRLSNFEGSEWVNSEVYKQNFGKFKKLEGIKSDAELRKLTAQVADFVSAKTSTVTGLKHQRASAIRSLHEAGYGFVNKGNYREFVDFMEDTRSRAKGRQFDSERIAELWHQLGAKRKLSNKEIIDNMDEYIEYQDELKKIPIKQNNQYLGSNEIKTLMKAARK